MTTTESPTNSQGTPDTESTIEADALESDAIARIAAHVAAAAAARNARPKPPRWRERMESDITPDRFHPWL